MKAALVMTGNEILSGDAVDTNGAYLGRMLARMGIEVVYKVSVRDRAADIKDAVGSALSRAGLALVTGGLGPTRDDVTREAVSLLTGRKLVFRPRLMRNINAFFAGKGMKVPEISRKQAFIPDGALALPNGNGTAPGFALVKSGKTIIVLPGPPGEMRPMFEKAVPVIKKCVKGAAVRKIIRTYGIGESAIEAGLADIADTKNIEIGFQARPGQVDIKVLARGKSCEEAGRAASRACRKISARFRKYIPGPGGAGAEETAGTLLRKKGLTLSVAESCSGGSVSNILTNVPGSSDYFEGAVISYANRIKTGMLGVSRGLIKRRGAVSPGVAEKMAEGVRRLMRTDCGLAVTGIAGPSGGTHEKPAGLVYIAVSSQGSSLVREFRLSGERTEIKERASQEAVLMLVNFLKGMKNA